MNITSPKQYRVAHELTGRVPLSIFLIFSHECGHCKTYLPMWERLAGLKKKKSNMFMMEADVFQNTPLSKKASANGVEVDGVPTVLYVSQNGQIHKADDIRNESAMTDVVLTGKTVPANLSLLQSQPLPPLSVSLAEVSKELEPVVEPEPEPEPETEPETETETESESESESEPEPEPEPTVETDADAEIIPNPPANFTMSPPTTNTNTNDLIAPIASSTFKSVLPGVEITKDILHDLPAATVHTNKPTIIQSGGSPWAAFLSSVAPAATLLGAYALLPKKNRNSRSSGLKRVSRRNKKMTRASTA